MDRFSAYIRRRDEHSLCMLFRNDLAILEIAHIAKARAEREPVYDGVREDVREEVRRYRGGLCWGETCQATRVG